LTEKPVFLSSSNLF